ncbi:MarR family transcriptional regulator [Streptomyces sp. NPDC006314]|uniref:ArsR/SmtB family transcription factor n=1 Tax=Streptomyces sp. NPDC006314 TaxID=3154475 RepID=UPI0033B66BA9
MESVSAGLGAALSSLHPAVTYQSGSLYLADSRALDVTTTRPLSLFPSSLAASWLLSVDPWDERGPFLIYPAHPRRSKAGRTTRQPAVHPPDAPFAQVIGHSRLTLLDDLQLPRTTTELADRHFMSASTVSYHLTRLHRAGLLTRSRSAHRVYYRRTPQADLMFLPSESLTRGSTEGTLSAVVSA